MTITSGELNINTTNNLQGRRLTLAEFLTYNDGTDNFYELVGGELVRMSLATGEHGEISEFLNDAFKTRIRQMSQPWTAKDMKIGIQSPRGNRWDTVRIPDLVVLPLEQWEGLKTKAAVIPLSEPPPLLVVEVVSPSTIAADYRAKRSEYDVLNIPEYWIVDPLEQKITICLLEEESYIEQVYQGEESLVSLTFPELNLTARQVLQAGR